MIQHDINNHKRLLIEADNLGLNLKISYCLKISVLITEGEKLALLAEMAVEKPRWLEH